MSGRDNERSSTPGGASGGREPLDRAARDEELDIARLLRAAGSRENPSDEMTRQVRAAVHAEWRASVLARKQRRMRRVVLLAASLVGLALALWVVPAAFRSSGPVVASLGKMEGAVQVKERPWLWWKAMDTPFVRAGERVRTGPDARLALTLPDGVSLRLDHETRVAFLGSDRVEVTTGAVYVDSGPGQGAGSLLVDTPHGTVRHVGTQYEARILTDGLRVRVREGRVDVVPEDGGAAQTVRVGEQLVVLETGQVDRGVVSRTDPEWAWAAQAAPAPDMEGQPVSALLEWVARETGQELTFISPDSEALARSTQLSGSIAGLSPQEALFAIMPTTGLRAEQRNGRIIVAPAP